MNEQERVGPSEMQASAVEQGFAYNSGTNPDFLSVEKLRSLIREHVDTTFQPV